MNRVILIGRLTRDPEFSTFGDGLEDKKMCKFTLAVNKDYKKDGASAADFINCVTFGNRADVIQNYCKKGTKIGVAGSWQTGSYVNQHGQKVYTNNCIVNFIEFCEKNPNAMDSTDYGLLEGEEELPF